LKKNGDGMNLTMEFEFLWLQRSTAVLKLETNPDFETDVTQYARINARIENSVRRSRLLANTAARKCCARLKLTPTGLLLTGDTTRSPLAIERFHTDVIFTAVLLRCHL